MDAARERFDRWAAWSGLRDVEIARRLGCDPSYPGKLRRREDRRRPGLDVAHAIERLTSEPRDDGERWGEDPIRTEEWLSHPAETTASSAAPEAPAPRDVLIVEADDEGDADIARELVAAHDAEVA